MSSVNPVPDGFRTLTPHLVVKGAAQAVEFYKKAFGAEGDVCMKGPDGSVMHAELRIGDSALMIAEELPNMGSRGPQGSSPVTLHLYVADVDQAFERAVKAGAKATMPVADMFWGDRYGKVTDPFGHQWSLATHKEDVSPEEMERRGQEFMKQMGEGCQA